MTERGILIASLLALMTIAQDGHPARNHAGPGGATGPPSGVATCTLRGVAEPRINTSIEDAQGRIIARFSGASTALFASDFPADARGRARIETGTGVGGFRVRGFVSVSELPLYTVAKVAVVPNHLWIAGGRSVHFVSATPGRIRIEKRVTSPIAQTFSAWAPCGALALAMTPPLAGAPPGDARAYVLKRASLELYAEPAGGAPLLSLKRAPEADGVLFFSEEQQGDFVRLQHHDEVSIDAWARAKDLVALPKGETMDQLTSPPLGRSWARLAVQGEPRVVKPVRAIPLRAVAREADAQIGVIEPGAETYVLDIVAGWASVMPKTLNVVPGPDGQFWVKAIDLGI